MASINLEIAKTPVTLNYDDALTAFRNQVNQKFTPELSSSNNRRTRRVNKVGLRGGGRGGVIPRQRQMILRQKRLTWPSRKTRWK